MSYPIDNFKKKCYRKCVYCIVLLNSFLKKNPPYLCIMVGISVGQISILLFCMEYILKITNLRFVNHISYFI